MNRNKFAGGRRNNSAVLRMIMNCTVPFLGVMVAMGTVCWINEARNESVFEYSVSADQSEETQDKSENSNNSRTSAVFLAEYIIKGTEKTAAEQQELLRESVPETSSNPEFIWPVEGGNISDTFISDRNHKGLDIAAEKGSSIYAAGSGVVTEAGWNEGGYGYYVMINHGSGYVTLYAHASEVFVSAGDSVSTGDIIAAVGSTGDSTGSHCHFEVRVEGEFCDPEEYMYFSQR